MVIPPEPDGSNPPAHQPAEQELFAAKATLRESSDHVLNIIESMTDGFVAVDADWRFTYLNPKAYELLQAVRQSQEELVGQNMWLAFSELVSSAVARRQPSAATVSHAACFTWPHFFVSR